MPADSDCLFHSIKILLDLQISVAQLRAQVVDYTETLETDERFDIINVHLLHDAGWTIERILGPQGFVDWDGDQVMSNVLFHSANSDDLHGERFVRLWE